MSRIIARRSSARECTVDYRPEAMQSVHVKTRQEVASTGIGVSPPGGAPPTRARRVTAIIIDSAPFSPERVKSFPRLGSLCQRGH